MAKRIFDGIGACVGLLFMFLFFPFIALAIVLESGRPIFVKLDRVSKGRVIGVYKFRSMVQGAHETKKNLGHLNERDGPFFKIKDDPRLTRVGKILRKFRLDEFPQFWNVFRGELSLIGPRPHEPQEIAQYPEKFRELYFAKAGLTGLSQVRGASALRYYDELEFDLYYVQHQSLWLDIKILLKTISIFFFDPTGV